VGSVLSDIVPFLGGTLVLALVLALVDETSAGPLPLGVRGGVAGAVLLALPVATIRRLSRASAEWTLTLEPHRLVLRDETGRLRRALATVPLAVIEGRYTYRTKYGTYRIPVALFADDEGELRVGVWDPGAARGATRRAKRPEVLVDANEFARLLATVRGAGSRRLPAP